MQIYEALNQTIDQFGIKAKDLAQKAGLQESALSKFRRGEKDLQARSIEKIFAALTDDQYHYLIAQLTLERKSQKEVIQLLNVIANKIEAGEIRLKIGFPESLLVS